MQKAPRGRPLETLGISEIEERVYEALLDRSGATSAELERDLALPARKLGRVIEQLEQKGLATRTTGQPRRFIPASPDIAVEALVLRRQDELRRARAEIRRLQERAAEGAGDRRQMIELITTHEAERHVFEQMQHAAKHELIFLERPPILIAGPEQPNETEMKALARGVRYRSIADKAFLELPKATASRLDPPPARRGREGPGTAEAERGSPCRRRSAAAGVTPARSASTTARAQARSLPVRRQPERAAASLPM